MGDGALNFWKVERKVLVQTRSQHCWVHDTESTLNKFQNKVRPNQNNISMISGWQKPEKMQNKRLVCSLKFTSSSTPKPPKLTQCLEKDREENYWLFFCRIWRILILSVARFNTLKGILGRLKASATSATVSEASVSTVISPSKGKAIWNCFAVLTVRFILRVLNLVGDFTLHNINLTT